jgi:hypothetical protein
MRRGDEKGQARTCRGAEEKQDILAHGMADLLAFDFDRLPASPG